MLLLKRLLLLYLWVPSKMTHVRFSCFREYMCKFADYSKQLGYKNGKKFFESTPTT